jgi:hypothetical protein
MKTNPTIKDFEDTLTKADAVVAKRKRPMTDEQLKAADTGVAMKKKDVASADQILAARKFNDTLDAAEKMLVAIKHPNTVPMDVDGIAFGLGRGKK